MQCGRSARAARKDRKDISMNIYLIRHGETAKNREKRLQGRSNTPLNENGHLQSGKARDFFEQQGIRFDRVYSSPLTRAVETAGIIAGADAEIITGERLQEMDYGPYEGCTLENPAPELIRFFSDFVHNPAPEGMESLDHVTQRLGEFLEEIGKEGHQNVLISTHAIAMKGALEYLTPASGGSYWSKYIGNCGIYRAEYSGGLFSPPAEIFSLGYEPGV